MNIERKSRRALTETKSTEPNESNRISVRLLKTEADSERILSSLLNPVVSDTGVIGLDEVPLNPAKLAATFDMSSALRPNVDAYINNIYSQDYRFEPSLDLNSPDSIERVRVAMYVESLLHAHDVGGTLDLKPPVDKEVAAKILELRRQSIVELAVARRFFSSCNPDGSYLDLMKMTGQNIEVTGNGYWEVLRGQDGKPRNLKYVPSVTMRIGPGGETVVKTSRKITDISHEVVKVRRTFKKFAQVDSSGQPVTWFKEFGDPRLMNKKTGVYYADLKDLLNAERKASKQTDKTNFTTEFIATEIIHFSISSLISLYGVPRWSGTIPSVLGSRELDETNLDYFLSNAIPALALLCSGGRLGQNAEERLKEFFTDEVRGRKAAHKLIVLEAETQRHAVVGPSKSPRLEFVPLRSSQQQDALFQVYDQRNIDKIGRNFRLPSSLLGIGKFSLEDMRFAEEQVYQPERESLDSKINTFLMPALGVKFWKYKSDTAITRDPEVVGKLVLQAIKEGAIVPAEARMLLEKVFDREFPVIRAVWAYQPMPLTLAALGIAAGPAEAVREQGRQDGAASPQNILVRELGLSPEEASVFDIYGGASDFSERAQNYNILQAIGGLKPTGNGQSNSEDGVNEDE
jgi:PBSX family phage portal protein